MTFDRGSSPLARGLLCTSSGSVMASRIIPARAGFTGQGVSAMGTYRDHPRSRGVYSTALAWPRLRPGSSPLARGLREP